MPSPEIAEKFSTLQEQSQLDTKRTTGADVVQRRQLSNNHPTTPPHFALPSRRYSSWRGKTRPQSTGKYFFAELPDLSQVPPEMILTTVQKLSVFSRDRTGHKRAMHGGSYSLALLASSTNRNHDWWFFILHLQPSFRCDQSGHFSLESLAVMSSTTVTPSNRPCHRPLLGLVRWQGVLITMPTRIHHFRPLSVTSEPSPLGNCEFPLNRYEGHRLELASGGPTR